jgi:GrpB-like predicted nucleotidyltransferase (UPF0157 family)
MADRTRPIIRDHQAMWPGRFGALSEEIADAAGPLARRIEHIGRTAITEMPAKDLLDVQMSVDDLAGAARERDGPPARLGFRRSPFEADHVPAGRADDPGRWAKRLWTSRDHRDGDVNRHVRLVGSPNGRPARLFGDWFRAHPETVPPYGGFKVSLAAISPDVPTYAATKDPVVDVVVVVAESWASATDWRPRT